MTKVQIKMPDYVLFGGSKNPPSGGIVWVETDEYYTLQVLTEIKKLQEQVATLTIARKKPGPKKKCVAPDTDCVIDEA